MAVTTAGIHVIRNTGMIYLLGDDQAYGDMDSDLLTDKMNFKEMDVAFIHAWWDPGDLPDANDFTFELLVSNVKDDESFVPFSDITLASGACPGFAWNIQEFGFIYARVSYKKGSVTSGSMKITARGKRG